MTGRVILSYNNYVSVPQLWFTIGVTLSFVCLSSFLIESSGLLKQDPNDVSAAALLTISQAMLIMANGSSLVGSSAPLLDHGHISNFTPSRNAVLVNTLWYFSLSLSIATAFMAMLAKDWCYSFGSKRTGHFFDQAHRRQRKWKLIERWKMSELIDGLPFLIHLSLRKFC
jgi:hypothetical protein